jgi:hypothetical protein
VTFSGIKGIIRRKELEVYRVAVFGLIVLHLLLILLLAGLVISDSDEAVYLQGFLKVFDTSQMGFQPPGWSYVDLNVIKILYSPAFLLSKLGFSEITSMRLGSLMYLTLTFTILLRYMRLNSLQNQYRKSKWLVLFVFLIPSSFFFTSLATRDSILGFFLVFTIFTLSKLENKTQVHVSVAYSISVALIFVIKPHYYLIILVSALSAAIWKVKRKKAQKKFLVLISTLSILPMFYFPGALAHQINSVKTWQEELFVKNDSPAADSPAADSPAADSPAADSPAADLATLNEISRAAEENSALYIFLKLTGVAERIEDKLASPPKSETAIARGATANIEIRKDESTFAYIEKFMKIFLFPLPFLDNGSLLLNLFALEIVLWLFLYTLFFRACLSSIKQRVPVSTTSVFTGLILICFVIMSLITEESIQVALRHRNVLALLMVISLGTFYKSTKFSKLP